MSTQWDAQARNWWRMLSPAEKLDVFENILFPDIEGPTSHFRLLMKGAVAAHFFAVPRWDTWKALCAAFHVNENKVLQAVNNTKEYQEGP